VGVRWPSRRVWSTPAPHHPQRLASLQPAPRPISAVVSSDAQVADAVTPHHPHPVGAWLAPADNITGGPMPVIASAEAARRCAQPPSRRRRSQGMRRRCSWPFSQAEPTRSSASMRRSDQPCPTRRTPQVTLHVGEPQASQAGLPFGRPTRGLSLDRLVGPDARPLLGRPCWSSRSRTVAGCTPSPPAMLVACHRRVIAGRQGMPAARQQVAVKVAVPPQASTVVEASLLAVEDREAAPQGQGQGARQRCWWGVIHAPGFGAALGDHRPDLAKVQSGGEMGAVSVQHDLPVGGAFTPLLAEVARPCRHAVGDRWYADETCVKVAGQWRYVYRAIDRFGQVIDGFVSPRRDAKAAHRFFQRAIGATRSRRSRSPPIGRRCTRRCWRSGCRLHGIAPTDTPTTESRRTTAG
jgi:DDE domain